MHALFAKSQSVQAPFRFWHSAVIFSNASSAFARLFTNFPIPTRFAEVCGSINSHRTVRFSEKKAPRSTTECPKNFTLFDTTCYRVFSVGKDFEDAASKCAAYDTNLAIIRSKKERKRIERVISTGQFYYVGATDAGSKEFMWSDAEKLVKISSEEYWEVNKRQDITSPSRCLAIVRTERTNQKLIVFQSLKCVRPLPFLCQTFSSRVQPVRLKMQSPTRSSVDGVYRPLAGVTYSGSPVYERSPSGRHLYHTTEGNVQIAFSFLTDLPLQIDHKDIIHRVGDRKLQCETYHSQSR